MKTQESLQKSADASLRIAIRECTQLLNNLRLLQKGSTARFMPSIREQLNEVSQHVHAHNAYRNVLETE